MSRTAYETLERFWAIQDEGDYTKLVEMFTDDATVEDSAVGVFHGKEAITAFMRQMAEELPKRGLHFELQEIAGDEETAWARWRAVFADGRTAEGVGIYRVRDGKLSYYRDYHNIAAA